MSKIPKTTQMKTVDIVSAIVDPNSLGINIRTKNSNGEIEGYFVPTEVWGRIPPNKNAAQELEKIARILNGYKEDSNGEWVPVENFKSRKINIETES